MKILSVFPDFIPSLKSISEPVLESISKKLSICHSSLTPKSKYTNRNAPQKYVIYSTSVN